MGMGTVMGKGTDMDMDMGMERDVNLARLGALYVALCITPASRELVLNTDSACCMDMLVGGGRVNAKYGVLLEATRLLVLCTRLRGGTVAFRKVKAHSGVQGNEEADCLAQLATLGDDVPAVWLPCDSHACPAISQRVCRIL